MHYVHIGSWESDRVSGLVKYDGKRDYYTLMDGDRELCFSCHEQTLYGCLCPLCFLTFCEKCCEWYDGPIMCSDCSGDEGDD